MNGAALLDRVVAIAHEAGLAIMAVYAQDFAVAEKADLSPLTEADQQAHTLIVRRLAELAPGLPVLSEEDVTSFGGPDQEGRYWLVDPLDGTKEFVRRNGEFTVNIALIERGHPMLGVVHAPVLGITYLAAKGAGAFKQSGAGERQGIRVSQHAAGAPWRVVGSRSHAGDSLAALLRALGPHELHSMGSSLKFCLVAEGSADIYPRFGPTSLWDTAAAQCVVEQAGGAVIRLTGEPLSYADPSQVLNPYFLTHGRSDVNWGNWLADAGVGVTAKQG
jgi:3'(2'), 5'-bisphosphate nucleotidase